MIVVFDKNGNQKNIVDFKKLYFFETGNTEITYIYGYVSRTQSSGTLYDVFKEFIDGLDLNTYVIIDIIFEYSGRHHVTGYLYDTQLYGGFILQAYNHTLYKIDKDNGVWSMRSIQMQLAQ